MEPKNPQITPNGAGGADSFAQDFAYFRPGLSKVTLTELTPDPTTGRYTATKPGNSETRVDTKAAISRIKADKARDAEKSAAAKKIMDENAGEIEVMRAPKPSKKYVAYRKKKLAAEKAAREK